VGVEVNWPGAHCAHALPDDVGTDPAPHAVQEEEPMVEYSPAPHDEQVERPGAAVILPASHSVQAL